ncbi:MAG: hypothetical protein ACFE7R_10930, partial [Candidatus Hodarchaeota archaeon]
CTVFNEDEESVWDVIIVHVIPDERAPIIDPLDNITYEEGSFGHYINWNITESNPDFFNITRVSNEPTKNDTVIDSGDWDGSNFSINVDGLNATRWYLYTLFVNDTIGYNSSSTVNVTVLLDLTAPALTSPGNITFEFGADNQEIRWHIYDSNPDNYSIEVIILGSDTSYGNLSAPLHHPENVTKENWTLIEPLGDDLVYNLDDIYLGNYTFTLVLWDIFGRNTTDVLNLTIFEDIRAPIINSSGPVVYEEGYTGYNINWSAEESNPRFYNLTRDGEMLQNGTWRGENISVGVDGLDVGTYMYNITFNDYFNQTASYIVIVTVEPDAHLPLISSVQVIQSFETLTENNLTVQAYAWDLNRIRNITVEWYTTSEDEAELMDMTSQGNDMFVSNIGKFKHGLEVHYRVTAIDNSSVRNEETTGWLIYEVTPMRDQGINPLFGAAVIILGALATIVVINIYFRTRTR